MKKIIISRIESILSGLDLDTLEAVYTALINIKGAHHHGRQSKTVRSYK